MGTARESHGGLATVVRAAVHSDDPASLIAVAGRAARQPLALVGQDGEPLGYAPDGSEGRRALAVARAAVHNRLVSAAGWSIVPIVHGSSALGFLAIGRRSGDDHTSRALVEVLPELIAEQRHRVAQLGAQRAAFVRRLVSDLRFESRDARREAADLGLSLADAYWPAILTWQRAVPRAPVVERLARDALRRADGSLVVLLDRHAVLLHPSRSPDTDGGAARAWLAQVVAQARTLAPSFPAQAIVADGPAELARVSAEVAALDALRQLGPRVDAERAVVPSREYALERLLWDHVDASAARSFVEEQLGPLIAWDREHRGDLLGVLEAALDFPRHDQAASRCFMHRNTFRHRLQQAGDVLGPALDDPDGRLAVHVALKLRRLLAVASIEESATSARGASAGNGQRTMRRPSVPARARSRGRRSRSA